MAELLALGCADSNKQTLPPIAMLMVEKSPGIPPQQSRTVSLPAPAALTFLGYEAPSHAHHFKSLSHLAPDRTLGTQFPLNSFSHAGGHGALSGQPHSQMPAEHGASAASQMLIANRIDPNSLNSQEWQRFVNAPLATRSILIAAFSGFQQQKHGAQKSNPQTRASTISPWPIPLPHIAQQHKTEAFPFPNETHHHNQGREHRIVKGGFGREKKRRKRTQDENIGILGEVRIEEDHAVFDDVRVYIPRKQLSSDSLRLPDIIHELYGGKFSLVEIERYLDVLGTGINTDKSDRPLVIHDMMVMMKKPAP
ncbi:hypothetical protein CEP54_013151 [Fusarium duplospermum]|uniref:Uncharacterized protein n=1 Tax=Fusarium duplospermum TaxID=1325734 RepID=A0A428P4K6_9HYPO|nr:hypothetical protein CEP54_013151 [Fusarium duplospermum]